MAQLALGAVGAVVGFYLGGPVGASIGWSLGVAAGGVLFAEGTETLGPRIDDLRVTTSAYGASVPLVYGAARVPGQVIWSNPIREAAVVTETGGKGGPTNAQTNYEYYGTFAISLCEGPITGIARIWVNGKVMYDIRDDSNQAALVASQNFATYFTLYLGSASQLADPTIEAALGVGNATAYRGTAYLVFANLPLNEYGARIPNIEVEVVAAGTFAGLKRTQSTAVDLSGTGGSTYQFIFPFDGTLRFTLAGGSRVVVFDAEFNRVALEPLSAIELQYPNWAYPGAYDSGTVHGMWRMFNGAQLRGSQTAGNPLISASKLYVINSSSGTAADGLSAIALMPGGEYFEAVVPCADNRRFLVMTAATAGGALFKYYLFRYDGAAVTLERTGTVVPGSYSGNGTWGTGGAGFYGSGMLEGDGVSLWLASALVSSPALWRIESDGVMREQAVLTTMWANSFGHVAMYADNGVLWCAPSVDGTLQAFTRYPTGGNSTQVLSAIVSDLCLRGGLSAPQINVTALTDSVKGYAIGRIVDARSCIQPLQRAFFFDAVESGGVLKFIKRGGASARTLLTDDLVPLDEGGNVIPASRANSDELPEQINVTYIAHGADYQRGAQSARRIAATSPRTANIELAVALTDTEAAKSAKVLLFDAWQSRTSRRLAVTRKNAELEPTDVITVDDGATLRVLRLTERSDDGARIEFAAVQESAAIYSPAVTATTVPGAGSITPLAGPTRLEMMDTPSLRDIDNDAGVYHAMAGYTPNWTGSELYKSTDGGSNYAAIMVNTTAAVIGNAITALGNHSGFNCFDELNTVDVSILSGTLSNATEAAVLAGANAALLADEVFQFKTATALATRQYRLSGLLRGRKGTERNVAAHVIGERFVLLSSSTILRTAQSAGDINVGRHYKAPSFKMPVLGATAVPFTNTGATQRPYAPVALGAAKLPGGNDVLLYWTRRGRLNNEWIDAIDVPVSETAELYDVEILNGTTVMRTLYALTTPSAIYSAAQQTADFGAPVSSVSFRVYQLSAAVGRGYPASTIATVLSNPGTPYRIAVLADTPVVYYRLNTTAGSETNLGSLGGSGTYSSSQTSRFSSGGPVNGGGYMAVAANGIGYSPTPGFDTGIATMWTTHTIECLFRAASAGQTSLSPSVMGKRSFSATSQTDFPTALSLPSGLLTYFTDSGNDFAADNSLTPSTTISTSVWHHVAAVCRPSGGLIELYLDGTLIASMTAGTTITTGSRNWKFGAVTLETGGGVGQSAFNGDIAECAIYSAALTQTQIQAHIACINN